jgi:hypothetical protein
MPVEGTRCRGRRSRPGRAEARLKNLPPGTRLGSNENAFLGGFYMWQK